MEGTGIVLNWEPLCLVKPRDQEYAATPWLPSMPTCPRNRTPAAGRAVCKGMCAFPRRTSSVQRIYGTSAVRVARVGRTPNSHGSSQPVPSPVGFQYGFRRGRTENPQVLNTQASPNATGGYSIRPYKSLLSPRLRLARCVGPFGRTAAAAYGFSPGAVQLGARQDPVLFGSRRVL